MTERWQVIESDCVEAMAELPESSVDAIVTDPPYGLSFMGKDWDSLGRQRDYVEREGTATSCLAMAAAEPSADREAYHRRQNLAMQEWHHRWAAEALRVLKPGGHLLAAGGSRTYHRLVCALEDAGFEIRDCITHLYGSGFPKSLNVGKAVAAHHATGKSDSKQTGTGEARDRSGQHWSEFPARKIDGRSAPVDPEWGGYGTALKPAAEFWTLARKPLVGTVAANVTEHGTGALNVDGCRIEGVPPSVPQPDFDTAQRRAAGLDATGRNGERSAATGRWPANVALSHTEDCELVGEREVASDGHFPAERGASGYGSSGLKGQSGLDERSLRGKRVEVWECSPDCPVRMLDEQTGVLKSGDLEPHHERHVPRLGTNTYGQDEGEGVTKGRSYYGDAGGASRFFYCAKASRAERNAGLDGAELVQGALRNAKGRPMNPVCKTTGKRVQDCDCQPTCDWEAETPTARNPHPTVKPISLMRWLVRLVTPPGGLVLDPFVGSGTTGIAAVLEGFQFVGIERDPEYVKIAEARIAWWAEHGEGALKAAKPGTARGRESAQMTFE